MHTIADLLDAACVTLGGVSDYALAKRLDVPTQSLYRWRLGQSLPENEALVPLAQLIGIDPYYAIACMVVARGKEENEVYWRGAVQRHPESVQTLNTLLKQTAAGYEREALELKARAKALRARARRGAASILLVSSVLAAGGMPSRSAAYERIERPPSAQNASYVTSRRERRRRPRRTWRPAA
jgi:transcriptional regulator with XRE-family HTH domain